MRVHPRADRLPMLPADELEELAASIKANGLRSPIVLDAEGMLIDGRNRLAACKLAGIEPKFTTLAPDDDPVEFIKDHNIDRRHITKGQRAMWVAESFPKPTAYKRGGANSVETTELGFSDVRLSHARTILRWASDLVDGVIGGSRSLDEAYRTALENKKAAEAADALLARLRASAPDLADLVVEGRMSLREALGALDARQREQRQKEDTANAVLAGLMSTLSPRDADPAQWAAQLFEHLNPKLWPPSAVPLDADEVEACASVLIETANMLRNRETSNGTADRARVTDQVSQDSKAAQRGAKGAVRRQRGDPETNGTTARGS